MTNRMADDGGPFPQPWPRPNLAVRGGERGGAHDDAPVHQVLPPTHTASMAEAADFSLALPSSRTLDSRRQIMERGLEAGKHSFVGDGRSPAAAGSPTMVMAADLSVDRGGEVLVAPMSPSGWRGGRGDKVKGSAARGQIYTQHGPSSARKSEPRRSGRRAIPIRVRGVEDASDTGTHQPVSTRAHGATAHRAQLSARRAPSELGRTDQKKSWAEWVAAGPFRYSYVFLFIFLFHF